MILFFICVTNAVRRPWIDETVFDAQSVYIGRALEYRSRSWSSPSSLMHDSLRRPARAEPPNANRNASHGQNHTRGNDNAENAALSSLLPLALDPVIAVCIGKYVSHAREHQPRWID